MSRFRRSAPDATDKAENSGYSRLHMMTPGAHCMSLRPCLLLAPPLFSLAGCVTFAQAPLPLACDARLQGRWLPIANNAAEAAKLTADDYAVVDGQCHATVSMSQDADKPARKAEL